MRYLGKSFLLRDWPARDLERIALLLAPRTFDRNQTIVRQGHATEQFFFV